jgi:hypothetical protein
MDKDNRYSIDKNTNKIVGLDILDNKKIETPSTIRQIKHLLFTEDLLIFIRKFKNLLEPIQQEEVKSKWNAEFKNNICLQEACYLEDFPNEYFYFIDIWFMKNGTKVLVFSLNH